MSISTLKDRAIAASERSKAMQQSVMLKEFYTDLKNILGIVSTGYLGGLVWQEEGYKIERRSFGGLEVEVECCHIICAQPRPVTSLSDLGDYLDYHAEHGACS